MPPKYNLLIYLRVNTRPCDSFNKKYRLQKIKYMGESSWIGELFNLFILLGHLREYEDISYL